jgi:hypothetical protein
MTQTVSTLSFWTRLPADRPAAGLDENVERHGYGSCPEEVFAGLHEPAHSDRSNSLKVKYPQGRGGRNLW